MWLATCIPRARFCGRLAPIRNAVVCRPKSRTQEALCEMTNDLCLDLSQDRLGTPPRAFRSVDEVVRVLADDRPIHCVWPQRLPRMARAFLHGFDGTVAYAVKCNPSPDVLHVLRAAGIRHFDVASRFEVDTVLDVVPDARLWFMHPIKSPAAIRHAWERGVTDFSLDSESELRKIVGTVGPSCALGLHVRLAVESDGAAWSLGGKFGASQEVAVGLLRQARTFASTLGICFHVGSQCMTPDSYAAAIRACARVAASAEVPIDVLDVGGGFPAAYPGMEPPPLSRYFEVIREAVREYGFEDCELVCEPGRAMAAESGSLLVKVEHRRDNTLYINDGTYGSLFDAGTPRWRYPTRLVRPGNPSTASEAPFRFFGPTCDSLDLMEGPFMLPGDVQEGDWIEIRQLGAYGATMRTQFNGFAASEHATIAEEVQL